MQLPERFPDHPTVEQLGEYYRLLREQGVPYQHRGASLGAPDSHEIEGGLPSVHELVCKAIAACPDFPAGVEIAVDPEAMFDGQFGAIVGLRAGDDRGATARRMVQAAVDRVADHATRYGARNARYWLAVGDTVLWSRLWVEQTDQTPRLSADGKTVYYGPVPNDNPDTSAFDALLHDVVTDEAKQDSDWLAKARSCRGTITTAQPDPLPLAAPFLVADDPRDDAAIRRADGTICAADVPFDPRWNGRKTMGETVREYVLMNRRDDSALEAIALEAHIPDAQYAQLLQRPPGPGGRGQLLTEIIGLVTRRIAEAGARFARLAVSESETGATVQLWLDRSTADLVSPDGYTIANPEAPARA